MRLYRLVGKLAVQCSSFSEWSNGVAGAHVEVGEDRIGGFIVQTRFLAIDMGGGDDDPALFQTTIWSGHDVGAPRISRCATWDEAEKAHKAAVARVAGWVSNAAAWTADLKGKEDDQGGV